MAIKFLKFWHKWGEFCKIGGYAVLLLLYGVTYAADYRNASASQAIAIARNTTDIEKNTDKINSIFVNMADMKREIDDIHEAVVDNNRRR